MMMFICIVLGICLLVSILFGLQGDAYVKKLRVKVREVEASAQWWMGRQKQDADALVKSRMNNLELKKLCLDYCAKKKREKLAKILIGKNL